MYFSEISSKFFPSNNVTLYIDGREITFNTRYPHECQYIAKILLDIRIPQADIDSALFKKFIKKGDKVLDAGANIGFTAIECLKNGASSVVAVEPVPEIFKRLVDISKDWEISPLQMGISNISGVVNMTVSQAHNQGSTINEKILKIFPQIFGGRGETVQIETTTIDAIVEQYGSFDIWKLDIEGAEVEALEGAMKTLAKKPPRVIIAEIYDDFFKDFKNIVSLTHPYGYRAFLRKNDYELELTDVNMFDESKYEQTSPMYIFSQKDLVQIKAM